MNLFVSAMRYCFGCFRVEPKKKKFPTREEFAASYLRQRFSLPDSIIYYITKNPKSSKCYQKMIQSCKHFFLRNQILVIHCLQIEENGGWKVCCGESKCRNVFLSQRSNITTEKLVGCKIWIQRRVYFGLSFFSTKSSNAASDLIPKIYQCDAQIIIMVNQRLNFEQFLIYSKNVKLCKLTETRLYSENDTEISVEALIASLPNLLDVCYDFHPSSNNVTNDTVKKLLQIPHFKNLKRFHIYELSQDFDIDTFYNYCKKNKHMKFIIGFKEMPSPDFAEKIDGIIDEILEDKFRPATHLFIAYPGQNREKKKALLELCYS